MRSILLSFCALMCACGGDDGVPTGPDAAPDLAASCERWATARCERGAECGGFAEVLEPVTCIAEEIDNCMRSMRGPGYELAAYTTGLDACATLTRNATCDQFPPVCKTPKGTLQSLDSCGFSAQCESGFCEIGITECGSCASGAPNVCHRAEHCADGLGCAQSQGASMWSIGDCIPAQGEGLPCNSQRPCDVGLYCKEDSGNPQCVKRGTQGMPCTPGTCADNLFCVNLTCQPAPRQLAEGATCDPLVDQCIGGYCESTTCQRYRDLGETCSDAGGISCKRTLTCSQGMCVEPPAGPTCE